MNFDRTSAIAGIVFAIVLVVLDKAGKLKGPALLVLLRIAALMLFPLALGNSWIRETPWGMLKFSKMTLMISIVGVCYSGFAVWISQSNSSEDTHSRYQTTDNLPRQDSNEEQKKLPGPYQPTQHEPRMDRKEPLQYSKKPATKTSDEKPPTMLDLFKRDFSYAAKVGLNDAAVKSGADGFELKIKRQVYLDFQGKSQFVGFYLESGNDFPQNERCYRAALLLAGHVPEAIAGVRKNRA